MLIENGSGKNNVINIGNTPLIWANKKNHSFKNGKFLLENEL